MIPEANVRSINMDKLVLDPGSVFASPEALLDHDELSKDQKIEILRSWQYDAAEVAVAEEEGMPARDSDLLRRILLALGQLTPVNAERVSLNKQHGLPSSAVKLQRVTVEAKLLMFR